LIERNSRLLLAQENFSSEQAAPSADAAGAVAAFISASDAVSDKLSQWLIPFLNQK
jgi:cholesterol transport system auxiliary component